MTVVFVELGVHQVRASSEPHTNDGQSGRCMHNAVVLGHVHRAWLRTIRKVVTQRCGVGVVGYGLATAPPAGDGCLEWHRVSAIASGGRDMDPRRY
eukprot:COSAG06_NODE_1510_length_9237_cov_9.498140_4_plen_96_part_00